MARKSTPGQRGAAPAHSAQFRRRLLRWFRLHGRDLPWRRTRDPYHITVAEFMLQQTQVSDRKSTRLNSSHSSISYAVFCLKKKRRKLSSTLILTQYT